MEFARKAQQALDEKEERRREELRQMEEKMYQLARDLEFEAAAQLRDEIHKLRERLLQV